MNRTDTNALLGLERAYNCVEARWSVNCEMKQNRRVLTVWGFPRPVCCLQLFDVHPPNARATTGRQFRSTTWVGRLSLHQTALGFLTTLSHALRDPFFTHLPVTPALSGPSSVHLQLVLSKRPGGQSPDFCAYLVCLRFFRHPAQVRSKPIDLFRVLRQVWPSGGHGFHHPQLSQSVAQHSPPDHSGPVVRLRQFHLFLFGAVHEPCPPTIHVRRLLDIPVSFIWTG